MPIRRAIVLALRDGLLVLTPHGGGRYELCSDRWTAVGPLDERPADYGLPEPVVAEGELFFAGPRSASEPFGFFTRFELATSRWKPFPREGAPRARFDPLLAWAGGRLVVLLGRDGVGGGAQALTDGATFDPVANRWTAVSMPKRVLGVEAAVPMGDRLFLWPNALYDARADRWTDASTKGLVRPYQAAVAQVPGGLLAVGGMWAEVTGSRYDAQADVWRQLPVLKLTPPAPQARHIVDGTALLLANVLPNAGTWAGDGAKLYPGHTCNGAPSTFHWLDGAGAWKTTSVPPPRLGATCWLTLVTADAVFLLRWPSLDGKGGTLDGEARAFSTTTGTWKRATVPAQGWPGSWGEVRWDGRAFWQWGARFAVHHAVEGQCEGGPTNMGCDPVVTTTSRQVDEGWRLEPVWEPLPAAP